MYYKDILGKLIQKKLFITREALMQELARIYSFQNYELDIPGYSDKAEAQAKKLSRQEIQVTTHFNDTTIKEGSIALHIISGTIYSEYDDYGWYFSTRQFIDDLNAAEANQKIAGHLFLIESGGGDAYYLDVAAAVVKSLTKPALGFIQGYCCSAALYLGAYTKKLIANTQFDTIGSIGTMMAFWDIKPYFEAAGFKWHELYATQSTLKNKKINDVLEGDPEGTKRFIEAELDPLAAEFIRAIKNARPGTSNAPEAVFQGETYYTPQAIEVGLIDGMSTIDEALDMLTQMIAETKTINQNRSSILKLIA
jgi:ClpP class serine protease